jgi:penicillin-binding protein 2
MFWKKKKLYLEIDPDEIFLDSKNIPLFDRHQFEGKIERPIGLNTVRLFSVGCLLVGIIFVSKIGILQIKKGDFYVALSEENSINAKPLFAERGVIYDRYGRELAWNEQGEEDFLLRKYTENGGFGLLLGYTSYPAKDKSGNYWRLYSEGKAGIEKDMNDILSGKNGRLIIEEDALGNKQNSNIVVSSVPGENISLSIDKEFQASVYGAINHYVEAGIYSGGAGIVMDIETGELIVITSAPEFSPQVMTEGQDKALISSYLTDRRSPFLNKAVSGLYTPGSIVKPYVAIGALEEGVISPEKEIFSSGQIEIPNPYFPELSSIFRDNKAHGYVDMRHALAVSSNVYFYEIGGGFQDQKGIGIRGIEKYSKLFGLGTETGVNISGEIGGSVPTPEWKARYFPGDPWRVGDTYHTSIGQYGFQVTPIQMVRAIAGVASSGSLVTPTIFMGEETKKETLEINESSYIPVKEGMKLSVEEGNAIALNLIDLEIAAKTGTAQVGALKTHTNSWVTGFFPYENPKYAFVLLMEKGPKEQAPSASFIMREALDNLRLSSPNYFQQVDSGVTE